MGLNGFIRFGYALLVCAVLLMILASLSRAKELDMNYPPCTFNILCMCSKPLPDLGIVQCRNVPFPALPRQINTSKVFMLHMENTGLRVLEPYFLQATGLYRLEVSHNPIAEISDDAFNGLERSLRELMLHENELIEVPSRSFRHLSNLRLLDLSGNRISKIEPESWRGLEDSLQTLFLSENSLSTLPPDCFSSLPILDTLDLHGNNIAAIDANVFRDGMARLAKLILADNLLTNIPYVQISPLKMLRTLDLSHNRIDSVAQDANLPALNMKLSLDTLHLDYNQIDELVGGSFQNFDIVNKTYFDGNPLQYVQDNAFRQAKIRELYIRNCRLNVISPIAFSGLEGTLQILDLSGNNLTQLPEKLFNDFDYLRSLTLRNNEIRVIIPNEMFTGFQFTLFKLDITGEKNGATNLQELRRLRNLRSLAVTKISTQSLSSENFLEYGIELEDLKISRGSLQSIKSHAFMHVRGLKNLDLSENKLTKIENDAFDEIGHSLVSLKLSHAFASSMTTLPAEPLRHLTSLKALDFSNNRIKSISDISFHFLKSLRIIKLGDNQIEQILKGTFQGDIHSKLEEITLSFNAIKSIAQHSFVDLEKLRILRLDDNRIEKIERRAFMNLDVLKTLNLRGNKLNSISDESFQNLPELSHLDLAYNSLKTFNFDTLDQVGTLASLRVNVSHNQIKQLVDNHTYSFTRDHGSIYHSNIKVLDLSFNNVTKISAGFFRPAEISLTHLYLGHNSLMNTTKSVFGNIAHLQWLDLSHNIINEMDYDSFKNSRKLQVIILSHNYIADIPSDVFKNQKELRIVDFSYNMLKSMPDNLFTNDGMERLDLSHNQLTKIPVTSLTNAAATLMDLDLSNNNIGAIHSMDLSSKFKSIAFLDLSNNRLVRLEDSVFATLPRLSVLDLSDNNELEITGKTFAGLENSLIELDLDNISLSSIPDLPIQSLRILKIAHNELPSIPPELANNMSALRTLDLSYNDLTNVPLITHSLPQLKCLSLAGNPITTLTNTSLLGAADTLETLDISHLNLNSFETGALNKILSLRTLIISSYSNINNFNIPKILEHSSNLRELWIRAPRPFGGNAAGDAGPQPVSVKTDLRKEMDGYLPYKLRNITFSGVGFSNFAETILRGVRSAFLHLQFINTSMTSLPVNFFKNIGEARNISLDFRFANRGLNKIPNPNSAHFPHIPQALFVTDVKIAGNSLNCDCSIGWVEFWQRKKRQYLCSVNSFSESVFNSFVHNPSTIDVKHASCDESDDDLRQTKCMNKNNAALLEVLKAEIECGWGSSAIKAEELMALIGVAIVLVLWI